MAVEHIYAAAFLAMVGAPELASVEIDILGARNAKGVFHVCLTAQQRSFPDCSKDTAAIKRTVVANSRTISVTGLPPGRYAVTLFHDENNNRRLDTLLGIPREGFGFSRNPVVRFGAPKFRQVDIQIAPGMNRQALRLQYLL